MAERVLTFRALTNSARTMLDAIRQGNFAGITFSGKRDIFEACGYDRRLLLRQYRDRYNRGDVAARVVEAFPEATWRGTGEGAVYDNEDPQSESPFELGWNEINERLSIWSALYRADVLAGLGHYAILLIGAPGDYASPLPSSLKPTDVAFLTPFCQEDAPIISYSTDIRDPRYGLPIEYQLRRNSATRRDIEFGRAPQSLELSRPVHWSRVIHIAENALDDTVFGLPRLERVWNRLDDLDKVVGAGSEAFWQRAHQGVQFNVDREIEFEEDEAKQFRQEIDDYLHKQTRAIRTRGVEMKTFGSDVAKFNENVASIISIISGTTKIPQRILLGSERGELASTQDRLAWTERVQDRRTRFAEPVCLRPLVLRFVQCGALPQPVYSPTAKVAPGTDQSATKPGAGKSKPFAFGQPKPKPGAEPDTRAAVPGLVRPDDGGEPSRTDDPVGRAKSPALTPELVTEVKSEPGKPSPNKFMVDWPDALDIPQNERIDMAVAAKGLGPTVMTDAEIRESLVGLEPMSEEDKQAAADAQLQQHGQELEKIAAKGPPFMGHEADAGAGPVKPGKSAPPFGARAATDVELRSGIVRKCGSKWCLYSHEGKVLGTHDSAKEAYAQEAAIEYSKARRAAEEAEHSGLFVYLKLDSEAAKELALKGEGAEAPESMHITVAYCDGDFDKAVGLIRSVAEKSSMLMGKVTGIGTFAPSIQSDGKTVLWAYPEVDGLDELHQEVVSALQLVGINPRTNRDYRPHITLAYVDADAELALPIIPRVSLYFSQLCVSKGDQREEFWLSSPLSAPSSSY